MSYPYYGSGTEPSTATRSEKRGPILFLLYGTEAGAFSDRGLASWSRHVERGIQTDELDRPAEVDYKDGGDGGSEFTGHYVFPMTRLRDS